MATYVPPPQACDLTHTAALYSTMSGTVLLSSRESRDKKERKGLPHRQIEAPLVPQSQLPGSDGCLRTAV